MEGVFANNFILMLLLVAGLAAAWLLGRRSVGRRYGGAPQGLSRDYFVGLNYLLNDEPDESIDNFIHALEINSNTLEMHMALGTLLRRRGKVDKSIVVYESVLERPQLERQEVNRVKVELIRSYIAAGLLDRAEILLEELGDAGPQTRCAALSLGINLYQLEKDWEKAVIAAGELLKICPAEDKARYQKMASHFYCELAEEEIARRQYTAAGQLLKKAQQSSRGNVRASLLRGQVEMALENYREAIRALLKVKQQDADYESETIVPLLQCYQWIGSEKHMRKFIARSLQGRPAASVLLGIADYTERESGPEEALEFLLQRLRLKPSLRIMNRAQEIMGQQEEGRRRENLLLFHDIVQDYLNARAMYQCVNCGFEARSLLWLCPGCNEWGEIKPIKGMVGE